MLSWQMSKSHDVLIEREAVERKPLIEVIPADFVPSLDQRLNQVLLRVGVGQAPRTYYGSYVIVRKGHDDLRRPIAVIWKSVVEGGVRIFWLPILWLKSLRLKATDRSEERRVGKE